VLVENVSDPAMHSSGLWFSCRPCLLCPVEYVRIPPEAKRIRKVLVSENGKPIEGGSHADD
jgi:hypothetical protein